MELDAYYVINHVDKPEHEARFCLDEWGFVLFEEQFSKAKDYAFQVNDDGNCVVHNKIAIVIHLEG